MTTRVIACAVTLFGLLGFPLQLSACTCVTGPPPSNFFVNVHERAFCSAEAVFVGTVVEVQEPKSTVQEDLARLDRGDVSFEEILSPVKTIFSLKERWRGPSATLVEIWTERDVGACGVPFRKGEQYLVYASRDATSTRLLTNICSGTDLLASSSEALDFIRGLQGNGPGAKIYGSVLQDTLLYSSTYTPLKNVTVVGEGKGKTRKVSTDQDGQFQFLNLEPGEYQFYVEAAPKGLKSEVVTIEFEDSQKCAAENIFVR